MTAGIPIQGYPKLEGLMRKGETGTFERLVFYDYCSSVLWLQGESGNISNAKRHAFYTLFFYCAFVAIGVFSAIDSFLISLNAGISFDEIGRLPVLLFVMAVYFASRSYMKSRDGVALSVFKEYDRISYVKQVAFAGILVLPLPFALVVARGSSFFSALVLVLHWLYLTGFGGYLLRKLRCSNHYSTEGCNL